MPDVTETVTTQHHDEPRYIYSGKKEIENAPVINHTDKELIVLEKLLGRSSICKTRTTKEKNLWIMIFIFQLQFWLIRFSDKKVFKI